MPSKKPIELEMCREKPTCGTPVVVGERRAHRRWHESMVRTVRHAGLSDVLLEVDEDVFVGRDDDQP